MVNERSGTVVLLGNKTRDGLYQTNTGMYWPNTVHRQTSVNVITWHERLIHVSAEHIWQSAAHVGGLPSNEKILEDVKCKICAPRKLTRGARPVRAIQNKEICGHVYIDDVGPV